MDDDTSPTVRYTLSGRCPRDGHVTLLDGETMYRGMRRTMQTADGPESTLAFLRRWAQDAAAHGVHDITLNIRRHTRALGWHSRMVRIIVRPLTFAAQKRARSGDSTGLMPQTGAEGK